jgi:tetratricopeptide (TPR) repeat protein
MPTREATGWKAGFRRLPIDGLLTTALLLGSFVYVWLRVQPAVEYHSTGPYFFCGEAFWQKALSRPGGLASYAGTFLAQLNFWNWGGALVFVVAQMATLLPARVYLERICGKGAAYLALVFPFALLLLRNRYGYPVFSVGIGLVLALSASAGLVWVGWRQTWSVAIVFILSLGVVFYLCGLWSTLLLAVLGAFCLVNRMRNRLLEDLRLKRFKLSGVTAVFSFLLGWAIIWMTFNKQQILLAQIDSASSRGQYESVLAAARQLRTLNHPAAIQVRLALYHTGRLAEELFSFRNMLEDPPSGRVGEDLRAQSETLFDLGLINDAEHDAHEALEMEGYRPDLLRLLARINLLKDRPQAAQVFLNVLSLIPFQDQSANYSWPARGPQICPTERQLLENVRARALTKEIPHLGLPVGALLDAALASNPTNRMAFEYAMATDLMDLNLERAVRRLRYFEKFNYPRIPRSYEEAVLLYQDLTGIPVDLRGRIIRPQTIERFRQFKEGFVFRPGRAAINAPDFKDTYWLYYAVRIRERASREQTPGS